jgi:hypothetical protein
MFRTKVLFDGKNSMILYESKAFDINKINNCVVLESKVKQIEAIEN